MLKLTNTAKSVKKTIKNLVVIFYFHTFAIPND